MLKETFIKLASNYSGDKSLVADLWAEIDNCHSHKKRYYHTLDHLNNLLNELKPISASIQNWDCILFTLYYHDIIYNSLRSDNEEKSALLAEERLNVISFPAADIEKCKKQIIATQKHLLSTDTDTNYFLDADLSVLGQDWETYSNYYKNIRKEYAVYPNLVYNSGRKKVLQHFLQMERIFKTDYFFAKYEHQAKENLLAELELLY